VLTGPPNPATLLLASWQFSRLFVTSMSPRAVLGLPGLLCCVSAARAKGHEVADIPVHVYGPAGLAQYLARVFEVGGASFATVLLCTN
jgi:ribonuclease BN (tRNA processing enzyme)